MTMACMISFDQEAAMTTTQLTHVAACREICFSWPAQQNSEHRALRRSWIVVTDENGKRMLRSRWSVRDEAPKATYLQESTNAEMRNE